MPYFLPAAGGAAGLIRKIFPNADPRFCALFIGSPPLPPSAMPTYRLPKSGLPGFAVALNVACPALWFANGWRSRSSSRGGPPSYVAALGVLAVHSSSTVSCVGFSEDVVKSGGGVMLVVSVYV